MPNKINTWLRSAFAKARRWTRAFFKLDRNEPIPPRVYWDDDVTLALSNLVQETETRASGRVQVISLADFRAAIGELWDKYKSRILIITESTIGRMIGRGNTYIPQGEDAWLLLFPGLPEDRAQQRADAIAATIGEKLVGAQFTANETPLPTASKLDLSNARNADGSLNMDAVKAAISKIKQGQISKIAVSNRPAKAAPAPVAAAGKIMQSAIEQLTPFFRPAWCAETESVDTFFFRASSEDSANIYADTALPNNDATILDLTRGAVTAFRAMCASGLQAKMAIPVPFSTLHGAALTEIQRMIAALPQRERLMRLRLEVVRIPSDVTADMLLPIRELFRPYVREVAFMVDLAMPHDQVLALDHIVLGVDVTASIPTDEDHIFQEMLMFRQRAGRRPTYILGLNNRAQVKRAIGAGFNEMSSPTLCEDVRRLPHRVPIRHRDELLAP